MNVFQAKSYLHLVKLMVTLIELSFFPHWIQVYPQELENVQDFNGFKDWLHTFDLYRGKKTGNETDDDSRVVGKFKVSIIN